MKMMISYTNPPNFMSNLPQILHTLYKHINMYIHIYIYIIIHTGRCKKLHCYDVESLRILYFGID